MSVQAMSYILDGHPAKGAERLVLLSLANHADGTEMECWPGVDLIAFEANISVDHVRRCIRSLDARGWITRAVNAAPDGRIPAARRPNLYRIVKVTARRVRAEVLPVASKQPSGQSSDPRGHGYANGASEGTRRSPTKPSVEPSVEPSAPNGAGHLPGMTPAPTRPPTAEQVLQARAHKVTTAVFERKVPAPATLFVAVLAIARRLLAAGHPDEAVTVAMVAAPTITVASVEFQLNQARKSNAPTEVIEH